MSVNTKSNCPIYGDIARVAVSRRRIARRIGQLADQIARTYDGQEVTILAVLTGSFIFLADLVRHLPMLMRLDVVGVSSYPGASTRSKGPRFTLPVSQSLRGKNVLIVDDILDTGQTLQALTKVIRSMRPASIRTCVLLRKKFKAADKHAKGQIAADFVGFNIGEEFVVGYGLDYNHCYRNLPEICVMRRHAGRPKGAKL